MGIACYFLYLLLNERSSEAKSGLISFLTSSYTGFLLKELKKFIKEGLVKLLANQNRSLFVNHLTNCIAAFVL